MMAIMCVIAYAICIPTVQKFGQKWRESSSN